MQKILIVLTGIFFLSVISHCDKSPIDSETNQIPSEQPNLLKSQNLNEEIPAAMDTLNGSNENTRKGGVYAAILRDIIFTNPLIGIPLLSTLNTPVQNPQPGVWIWEKQIFQAAHQLKAKWDGKSGYNWTYLWNGGLYHNYLALEGHTDVPGLNGNYSMYYIDASHSIYGTKTWSVDDSNNLTIEWIRAKYDPLNIPKRHFLAHFNKDGSGDLIFWKNNVKRFYIEWLPDGSGSWTLWFLNGSFITGEF